MDKSFSAYNYLTFSTICPTYWSGRVPNKGSVFNSGSDKRVVFRRYEIRKFVVQAEDNKLIITK